MSAFCVPMSELSDSDSDSDGSDHSYFTLSELGDAHSERAAFQARFLDFEATPDDQTRAGDIGSVDWDSDTEVDEQSGDDCDDSEEEDSANGTDTPPSSIDDIDFSPEPKTDDETEGYLAIAGPAAPIFLKSVSGVLFPVDEGKFVDVLEVCPGLQYRLARWYPLDPVPMPFTTRLLFIIVTLLNASTPADLPLWFSTLGPDTVLFSLIRTLAQEGATTLAHRAIQGWYAHAPWTAFCAACELGYWERDLVFAAIRNFIHDPIRRDPHHSIWLELVTLPTPRSSNGRDPRFGEGLHEGLWRLYRAMAFCTLPSVLAATHNMVEELQEYWNEVARVFDTLWTRPLSRREVERLREAQFIAQDLQEE